MPRRTATLSPMSAAPASRTLTSQMLRTAEFVQACAPIKRLLQASTTAALLSLSGFAFAQTPVCFDNVGRALPPEQCSKAARDQAAEQAAASGAGSPSLRNECRALADKIANTPDKPVYTRDKRVDSPAGDRVDIPTRTNPRKALKEEYVRKCT
ncbi:hypothetical protein [Pandoraea apista]|uniref:hypothetical protein n=1 Tax=Pandoraea apista TaxID=93218 RepID=UPI00065A5D1E|nr:hypothetical protein [Pandoraea apista]ALS66348.1 hypothetical protein AT395_16405 [Pandoraea apista]RRW96404.1 hypothetical protein EGJ54_10235 [Pandoraea apista]RRX03597.1 hypothetical protein EGJ56_11505 [Pandoraea apista]CFB61713.1 hypothetical protein LMG16407_01780 [Pandoraea apista]